MKWQQYLSKTPLGKMDRRKHKIVANHSCMMWRGSYSSNFFSARILIVPAIQAAIGILWILLWALSASFLISQVPDGYTPKAKLQHTNLMHVAIMGQMEQSRAFCILLHSGSLSYLRRSLRNSNLCFIVAAWGPCIAIFVVKVFDLN